MNRAGIKLTGLLMPQDVPQTTDDRLLSFTELMTLAISFNNRIDTLWQRVLYTHAAIVGVMVFFATSSEPFDIPRILVFFFYSLNTAITISAFSESYSGLCAALDDLKDFPKSERSSNIQGWVLKRSYHRHARRRVFALVFVWLVLGYLLVYPIAFGFFFG